MRKTGPASLSLITLAAAALLHVGCGRTDYLRESYGREGSWYETGENNAWILIESDHTYESGLYQSHDRRGPPYKLVVHVHALEEPDGPVLLRQAQLAHQGRTIAVTQRGAQAPRALFGWNSGYACWTAKISIPLGDQLSFVEGSTVRGRATVSLPYQVQEETLKAEFKGRREESSGTWLDALMGV